MKIIYWHFIIRKKIKKLIDIFNDEYSFWLWERIGVHGINNDEENKHADQMMEMKKEVIAVLKALL